MARSSSDIQNALIAKLGADAALLALMPNGVYEDHAPQEANPANPRLRNFVIVSHIIGIDYDVFEDRAIEDFYFLVEARSLGGGDVKAAADRIDFLLHPPAPYSPATLTVSGYTLMTIKREEFVRGSEQDDVDKSIVWKRRGGRYRVMVST